MKKFTPLTRKQVHFIGIGGIGMSALARWFLRRNWAVSGSDIAVSEMTKALVKEGVQVKIGHHKGHISPSLSLVIYNRAIPKNNPELVEARRLGICVAPYAKALGDLTRMYRTIAVTGSHGKSTTTALAALALIRGGLDPTVLLGTTLTEFGGKNIRIGKEEYAVFEADDFGGAFLEYSPALAIITNIDKEHLDFYETFSNLKKAFLKFIARITPGGTLIVNKDDAPLSAMRTHILGIARKNKLKVIWYSRKDRAARKIRRVIKIPGDYNVSNALAAFTLGTALKISGSKTLAAIGAYHGSWRRQEYRGEVRMENGEWRIKVFDDYAHHPTEIKASLRGFREKFPHSPLICVFQPHQAERLKLLFREFQTAFDDADITIILPLYKVAGRHHNDQRFTSETLARTMQKKYPQRRIFYLANPKNLKKALAALLQHQRSSASHLRESAVLLMMGAGDIVRYTNQLISAK